MVTAGASQQDIQSEEADVREGIEGLILRNLLPERDQLVHSLSVDTHVGAEDVVVERWGQQAARPRPPAAIGRQEAPP